MASWRSWPPTKEGRNLTDDSMIQKLGEFNGSRGVANTVFGFGVPQAGVYPIRLIWHEGDANSEWFTLGANGQPNARINSTHPSALKAF